MNKSIQNVSFILFPPSIDISGTEDPKSNEEKCNILLEEKNLMRRNLLYCINIEVERSLEMMNSPGMDKPKIKSELELELFDSKIKFGFRAGAFSFKLELELLSTTLFCPSWS